MHRPPTAIHLRYLRRADRREARSSTSGSRSAAPAAWPVARAPARTTSTSLTPRPTLPWPEPCRASASRSSSERSCRVVMLRPWRRTGTTSSPLAVAALGFIGHGVTAADLDRRLADAAPTCGRALRKRSWRARVRSVWCVSLAAGTAPDTCSQASASGRSDAASSDRRRGTDEGPRADEDGPAVDHRPRAADADHRHADAARVCSWIRRHDPTPEQRQTMLETMERNAERMQRPDRRDPRPGPLPVRHDRAPTAPLRRAASWPNRRAATIRPSPNSAARP